MKRLLSTVASVIALAGVAAPSALADKGDLQFRLRALAVQPDESANIEAIGGDVMINNTIVPELDISYFLTDHIAAELILGVTPHDALAQGTAVGDLDLGSVTLLPPTLTLQYHFNPHGTLRPYAGVGLNYTLFFNEDLPSGTVLDSIDYDPSLGLALQAGIDYQITDRFFVNLDVKKVWINTDVTVDASTALGAVVGADVDIDPMLIGIGIGWKY